MFSCRYNNNNVALEWRRNGISLIVKTFTLRTIDHRLAVMNLADTAVVSMGGTRYIKTLSGEKFSTKTFFATKSIVRIYPTDPSN